MGSAAAGGKGGAGHRRRGPEEKNFRRLAEKSVDCLSRVSNLTVAKSNSEKSFHGRPPTAFLPIQMGRCPRLRGRRGPDPGTGAANASSRRPLPHRWVPAAPRPGQRQNSRLRTCANCANRGGRRPLEKRKNNGAEDGDGVIDALIGSRTRAVCQFGISKSLAGDR